MSTRNFQLPEVVHGHTTAGGFTNSKPVPFEMLPAALRGMGTQVVYISPGGQLWHLAGPHAGKEGVSLNQQLTGDQQWPFDVVVQDSAYMMGSSIQKVNVNKRVFNLGIVIGRHNPQMTEYQYRMAEDHWWQGQDENQDGWLGIYTRFSGWRWIPVRPETTVKTPQRMDTTAYGNNVSLWDISLLAVRPYFTKPASMSSWSPDPDAPAAEVYTGTIHLANRGDLPSYVSFLVSSPGRAWVQDNDSTRMVKLPRTRSSDGTYLCDTEPGNRTLTAKKDPVDNLAYDFIRQSKVLDFLLHDVGEFGEPLQLRFNDRFMFSVPPKTSVALTVQHTSQYGKITAIMPQRFKRSR